MQQRFAGLFRDTWWLMLAVTACIVFVWVVIAPLLGILVTVSAIPVFLYFAFLRYDKEGNDRG